jgi:hypothetical protein
MSFIDNSGTNLSFVLSQSLPRPIFLDINNDKDGTTTTSTAIMDHPLTCPICYDIPLQPVITPCQHIFCYTCIETQLQHNSICPIDRNALTLQQIANLTGTEKSIWDNTSIQCPKCEQWTGVLQQYSDHVTNCTSKSLYVQELEQKVIDSELLIKKTKDDSKATIIELQCEILQQEMERLYGDDTNTFDFTYRYNRRKVVELSQFICRHLHVKPSHVDSHRIFDCVRVIYDDLVRCHNVRPVHHFCNVHMLLSICKASTWFTYNQHQRIVEWIEKYHW